MITIICFPSPSYRPCRKLLKEPTDFSRGFFVIVMGRRTVFNLTTLASFFRMRICTFPEKTPMTLRPAVAHPVRRCHTWPLFAWLTSFDGKFIRADTCSFYFLPPGPDSHQLHSYCSSRSLFLVRIGNECPPSHHHLQCNRLVQSLSLDCYVADSLCTYSEMCKYLCLSPGACLQGLASKLSSLRVATASFPGTVRIKVPFTQKT